MGHNSKAKKQPLAKAALVTLILVSRRTFQLLSNQLMFLPFGSEHWMIRWMDAYREGKGTKEAQIQKVWNSQTEVSLVGWLDSHLVARAFD